MGLKAMVLFLLVFSLTASALFAEEGGSGHYMPGQTASFIDVLPDREAFLYVNVSTYYDGSTSTTLPLGQPGVDIVGNIDATVYANTSFLVYQTPWKIFGGRYGAGLAIPYYDMEVTADVTHTGPGGTTELGKRDKTTGLGDIELFPFILGWKKGDVSYGTSLGLYTPTGEYEEGALANPGKNYWTFEPAAYVSWLSSKIGTEVSTFVGYDISTENQDTDYQSGNVFHIDTTVAQHLPLFGGFIGAGANAFYYKQITGDSGDGAKLGDFKGQTMGVGPVLSYATKVGQAKTTDLVIEVKWLPESDVDGRLEGDIIWAKVALAF